MSTYIASSNCTLSFVTCGVNKYESGEPCRNMGTSASWMTDNNLGSGSYSLRITRSSL